MSPSMHHYMNHANECLAYAPKLPKGIIKRCKGLVLVSSREYGIGLSGSSGAGVLLAHTDGKWSPPVAIKLEGYGAGVALGAQDKCTIIVLGGKLADKLIEGEMKFKLNLQGGLVIGGIGREAEIATAVAQGGSLAASYSYSFTEGLMVNVQLETNTIFDVPEVNKAVYNLDNAKAIVEEAEIPDVPEIKEFMAKVEELTADKVEESTAEVAESTAEVAESKAEGE